MKTMNEVLAEVFAISPLPNKLKSYKKRWKEGKLKSTAIVSVIERYSDYEIVIDDIVCVPKVKPISDAVL
jgi:hypothetical protein